MNEKLTFDPDFKYENRIMRQLSNFLKKNNIHHRNYTSKQTIVIDDGFKTVIKSIDKGYWKAWRLDKQLNMSQFRFRFFANSQTELILKCVRFQLIPYSKAKKLKF